MQATAAIQYEVDRRSGGITSARLSLATCEIASASGAPGADLDDLQIGSLYLRNDGTPGATLYVKLSSGWSAIA